uniref:Tumor necrosis factor receptor superfamily member 6 n=1 Tax=Anser cygnoides TaxID=8845 RepID=A0A8B9DPQ5_ANSCY|nr:tumor necrosis factor receptor superfamily member 6 [Anser cygnoides]
MPADRGFPAPDPASSAQRECPRWGADRRGLPRGPSQRRAPRLAASPGGTRTAPASARPLSTPAPGRGGPASCLPTWEEPGRSRAAFASRQAAGQRWGMARGLLTLLFVAVLITEAECKNDTEHPIHVAYNRSITRKRIIAKREIKCTEDEFNLNGQCCKKCKPGHVKNTDCPTNTGEHCESCKPGEYMDHVNNESKCKRCASCDSEFGFQVAKACTKERNTECICAENYFCSSVPCTTHCEQCNTCENVPVERECTPTSDTVCREKGMPPWGIAAVVILVIVFLGSGALSLLFCKRKRKSLTCQQNPGETLPEIIIPLVCTDVDLSSHIPIIAEEMTLPQVKKFVRYRQIPDPVIDQVLQDNVNDTSEQKIKLLQAWYQSHGIKGAYGTLLSSLRTLKMCAVADKIEEKLKAVVSSNQEVGQSYNDDIEQRKTCSQEGGKSYHDNAELSKTYSEGLEET